MSARASPRGGTSPLSNGLLAIYASPAVPLAVIGIPLFIYLPTFYGRELGLDIAAVGLALMLARMWDVVTDPLVGWLSDRTRGRFGRRKPWMIAGLPLLLLSIWFLFLPPVGVGPAYLLGWSLLLYLAWTMITLPYQSWGAELSPDYHERTRIAGWREGGVVLGTALATMLPLLVGTEATGLASILKLLAAFTALGLPIAILLAVRAVPDPPPVRGPGLDWRQGLRVLIANRPFRRLLIAYFINGVANGLPATLFILFVAQVIDAEARTPLLLFVYFLAGILAVPFWLKLSYRLGKHRAWSVSMLWVAMVFAAVPLLGEGDFWPYFLICVLSGAGLGADLALPTAMQADVVDVDARQTGEQRTGLYFAIWGMATKLALAMAVGLAFPILGLVGFDAGGSNDPGQLFVLSALYGLLPLGFKLAAVAMVWNFPLDAESQLRLRREMAAREAR